MAPRRIAILALAALTGCALEFEPAWEGSEKPPNILFISVDTLRADHLGCYGYDRPTSPNTDRLAASGTVFDNAQASASWTLPGLASVLTSYYSSTHRCWSFASRLDPSFPTLTEQLRDAGYDTACVTSHIYLATRYGLQQGFVHFDDSFAHPEVDPKDSITSERVSDEGVLFLEQKASALEQDVPWFLWLHYFDPHGVYLPHEGFSEQFGLVEEIDLYDGEIAFTDFHVGRVLDALDRLGLTDDTVVVFFSDHGEEFGDHGGYRHGHDLHRELVQVPLVMRVPGVAPGRVSNMVRTVDVMPTLLELAGLPAPEGIEGSSFLAGLREGRWRSLPALQEISLNESDSMVSVVHEDWRLIQHLITREVELYDLAADPLEETNVAALHPDKVEELKLVLERMIQAAARRAEDFDKASDLGLTQGQMDALRGLGYLGDDE
jgi:arylsulfatase A-like enzyme